MITIFGFKNTKISEYEIIKMLLMSKSGIYKAVNFNLVGEISTFKPINLDHDLILGARLPTRDLSPQRSFAHLVPGAEFIPLLTLRLRSV